MPKVLQPYIAFDRADVAIRRPGTFGNAWNWARRGSDRPGTAWLGKAGQGKEFGEVVQGEAWRGEARNLGWRNNQQTQTHTEQGTQHNTTLNTCTRKTTQSR